MEKLLGMVLLISPILIIPDGMETGNATESVEQRDLPMQQLSNRDQVAVLRVK